MCFDCDTGKEGTSISAVYCEDCFDENLHKGHYFSVYSSMGGLCDCGNEESLKKESFCKKHKVFNEDSLPLNPDVEMYAKEV